MCGIVGFTGHRAAAPILLNGLSMLEYRGYDSAGLAVREVIAPTAVVKAAALLAARTLLPSGANALWVPRLVARKLPIVSSSEAARNNDRIGQAA